MAYEEGQEFNPDPMLWLGYHWKIIFCFMMIIFIVITAYIVGKILFT